MPSIPYQSNPNLPFQPNLQLLPIPHESISHNKLKSVPRFSMDHHASLRMHTFIPLSGLSSSPLH